jgi:hypothetical protein
MLVPLVDVVTQQTRGLLQYQGRDRFLWPCLRVRVRPFRDLI